MLNEEITTENLKKRFNIPFYYKRIKIVGENKTKYGFNKPTMINSKIVKHYSQIPKTKKY